MKVHHSGEYTAGGVVQREKEEKESMPREPSEYGIYSNWRSQEWLAARKEQLKDARRRDYQEFLVLARSHLYLF